MQPINRSTIFKSSTSYTHTHTHTGNAPHTHNTKIELGANERREENSIPSAPSSRAERGSGVGLSINVHILKCAYHAGLIHNEVRRRENVHHHRTHHTADNTYISIIIQERHQ